VKPRRGKHPDVEIILVDKQLDLGAARDDALGAARDEAVDDVQLPSPESRLITPRTSSP